MRWLSIEVFLVVFSVAVGWWAASLFRFIATVVFNSFATERG
jgi:hypothetical protein